MKSCSIMKWCPALLIFSLKVTLYDNIHLFAFEVYILDYLCSQWELFGNELDQFWLVEENSFV